MIEIDEESTTPLYIQIADGLRDKIEENHLKVGDKLPPYRELMSMCNVSMITVKQAITELVNDGLLYRRQGKGTFVTKNMPINKRTFTLGLLLTDIRNPFFSHLARSVQDVAHTFNYSVIYHNTDDKRDLQGRFIDMLIEKRVDGVIITPINEREQGGFFVKLQKYKIPFVYIDRYLEEIPNDYVVTDNFDGAYQAVTYLISLGHKRIGCVAVQPFASTIQDRISGYKEALAKHNIPVEDSLQITHLKHLNDAEEAYEAGLRLLSLPNPPSAIFATNDILAIGVYRAAKEKGLQIPNDLSLIGFDNIERGHYSEIPLTTISQPINEMGKIATEILVKKIEGRLNEIQKIVLKPKLVIRESCMQKQG